MIQIETKKAFELAKETGKPVLLEIVFVVENDSHDGGHGVYCLAKTAVWYLGHGSNSGYLQTQEFRSGGLWGVDDDELYQRVILSEELSEIFHELRKYGVLVDEEFLNFDIETVEITNR